MRRTKVHLKYRPAWAVCGRRPLHKTVLTERVIEVTCRQCQQTIAYRDARRRMQRHEA